MQTWHCTTQERHLPHTWFYRHTRRWFRCDGQQIFRTLKIPTEEQPPCT